MELPQSPLTLLAQCPLPLFPHDHTVDYLLDHSSLPPLDPLHESPPLSFPLSLDPPQVDLEELRARPVPHSAVIDATVRVISQDGPAPIRSMLDTRYDPPVPTPVGMIRYWLRVTTATRARRVWENVRSDLADMLAHCRALGGQDFEDLTAVWTTFGGIPWHHQMSKAPSIHSHDLLDLLAGRPLQQTLVDTLLLILRRGFQQRFPSTACHVSILSFSLQDHLNRVFAELAQLHSFASPLSGEPPRVAKAYIPWLSVGSYRLYVLDANARVIRHGAMSGQLPVLNDIALLRRWLELSGLGTWEVAEAVPFGGPEDGGSCGVALVNAIRHDLHGEQLWSPRFRDINRVREFRRVMEWLDSAS